MEGYSLQQLLALSAEPNWADADPAARHCLPVRLEPGVLGGSEAARVARWLARQPLPVVAVSVDAEAPLRRGRGCAC